MFSAPRPTRRTGIVLTAAVVTAGLTLTACSTSTDGGVSPLARPTVHTRTVTKTATATPKPVVATSAVPSSTTTSSTPTSPTSPPTAAPTQTTPTQTTPPEIAAVLLKPGDLGRDFRAVSAPAPSPLPCTPTSPPINQQVKSVESGIAAFQGTVGRTEVSEQIFVYGSETEAIRHQQLDEQGLGCSHGTVGSTPVDLAGPYNIVKVLGLPSNDRARIDKALNWPVSNSTVDAGLYFVRIHAVVVQFTFAVPSGTAPGVNVKQAIDTAIERLLRHAA